MLNNNFSTNPIRLLYLPNEDTTTSLQRGPRAVFSDMLKDQTLSDYHVFSYIHEANQLGDITKWETKFFTMLNEFQPNVIFWQHIRKFPITEKLLRKIKELPSKPVLIYHEGDPYGKIRNRLTSSMKLLAKYSDILFLVELGEIARLFSKAGAKKVIYSPSCADATLFGQDWNPWKPMRKGIVMIGNNFVKNPIIKMIPPLSFPGSLQREQLALQLFKKFGEKFKVYGSGWGKYPFSAGVLPFDDQEIVLRQHLLSVNWDHFPDLPFFFSNRLPIALISGVAHATNYHPGYELMFKNGEQLVYYNSIKESVDIIDWMFCQPEKYLIEMGMAGEQFVRKNLTTDIVYRRMFQIIKETFFR
jgi:hypothetical protein